MPCDAMRHSRLQRLREAKRECNPTLPIDRPLTEYNNGIYADKTNGPPRLKAGQSISEGLYFCGTAGFLAFELPGCRRPVNSLARASA